MNQSRFLIVTPVYEDEVAARQLIAELVKEYGNQFILVIVDDGSVREPAKIDWLSEAGCHGVVLTLNRNIGHQRALAVGMSFVVEKFPNTPVVTMDSDGEDMPGAIRTLFSEYSDNVDIVTAARRNRVETSRFKIMYFFYRKIFQILCGRNMQFGNFALYSPGAIKRLSLMPELWIHIAATVLCSKLRVKYELIDRGPRYAGRSKMNFTGLALHGFRGLMVFAEDVLVRVGTMCASFACVAGTAIMVSVVLKLSGYATPGWFSLSVGILLLMMFQTGAITLMTLMLTGISKAIANAVPPYERFVDTVVSYDPKA